MHTEKGEELMDGVKAGIVGCGMIAGAYYKACGESKWLIPAACADLVEGRAEEACAMIKEKGWGEPVPMSFDDMLANDEIGIIFNLTNPKAHYPLNLRALEAGKHVYAEKPLAITREEGKELLSAARANNVLIGCAPDTFLGPAHQTARSLLDSGAIGEPTAGTFFFAGGGPDGYHQDPEFFFEAGAGAMFDVGVYSLTHAVNLLGPVKRVSAFTKKTWEERTILSKKKLGQKMPVEVPTHVSASLEFENGAIGTFLTSFDIKGGHHLLDIEIYGTDGSLQVPSPNGFDGDVSMRKVDGDWEKLEHTHGHTNATRGIGGVDLVAAAATGRPLRASGELAYHVLDIGLTIYESAEKGAALEVASTVERPALMQEGLTEDF
ncbi:MAG: Gfo/Idh/MocA family oxidoreductase [Kiritimatiellia bacterium]|jgi:predicted dehydrogenase|nr:Gfo/Idh/MocA family oxidoreductase [Kiritimatiellia bacterium]